MTTSGYLGKNKADFTVACPKALLLLVNHSKPAHVVVQWLVVRCRFPMEDSTINTVVIVLRGRERGDKATLALQQSLFSILNKMQKRFTQYTLL